MDWLQVWAFCTTFQYYLGITKAVDFETFFNAITDEVMFKVITARRSHLPNELVTNILYMLDDPDQDNEPILEEKHWRDVMRIMGHTAKVESQQEMMEVLLGTIFDLYDCEAFRDHCAEQCEVESRSKTELQAQAISIRAKCKKELEQIDETMAMVQVKLGERNSRAEHRRQEENLDYL